MFTKAFAFATFERAVKTLAQSAIAVLVGNVTGLLDVDWVQLASVSGLAALISILTSVASGAATGDGPSLTHVETIK